MSNTNFNAFVRRTAVALDRRSALGVLGGAALAAVVNPLTAGAKKPSKKKCNKKENRCRATNPTDCSDFPGQEPECVAALNRCCRFVGGTCDVRQAFRCCRPASAIDQPAGLLSAIPTHERKPELASVRSHISAAVATPAWRR